ncbi:MAG: diacylglycerol kinase [Burkholderiaceae bacterium]
MKPNNHSEDRGLLYRRLIDASSYSLAGLKRAWKEESIRVEVVLLIPLFPLGWWLGSGTTEKLLLVLSLVTVILVELLNTAIEIAIDRISDEEHPLSKDAKDVGSAAVLIAMLCVLLVWGSILLPRYIG